MVYVTKWALDIEKRWKVNCSMESMRKEIKELKCKHCFGGPVHHNVSENVVFQISKKCENNSNLDIMSRTMRVIIKLSSKLIIIEFFLNTPCRQIVKSFGDLKKWIILVEAYENQNTDIDHLTFCQIYDLIVIHHKTQNFTFVKSNFFSNCNNNHWGLLHD